MRSFESMQVNSQKEQCYIPINSIKSRKSIASTLKGEILFHVHVPTSSFEKIKTIDGVQRSPNLYFNPHRFLMCRRMGKKMEKLFSHWWFVLSLKCLEQWEREKHWVRHGSLCIFKPFTPSPLHTYRFYNYDRVDGRPLVNFLTGHSLRNFYPPNPCSSCNM